MSMQPNFYMPNTKHWLYFGWENDRAKSCSTMGGAVYPGGANGEQQYMVQPICYTVTVGEKEYLPDETSANRRKITHWYQADGYMNSPVSEWSAGETGISIKIQHIPNRVFNDRVTVVFTQVTLKNTSQAEVNVLLNVSAASSLEVPLTADPAEESTEYMVYEVSIPAQGEKKYDFAAVASATGTAAPEELKTLGSFDAQYAYVKSYYDNLIRKTAHPVSLPDSQMVNFYLNSMIIMREAMVKTKKLLGFSGIHDVSIGNKEALAPCKIVERKGTTDYCAYIEEVDLDTVTQLSLFVDTKPSCGIFEMAVMVGNCRGQKIGSCLVDSSDCSGPVSITLQKGDLSGKQKLYFVACVIADSVYADQYEIRTGAGTRCGIMAYDQYFSHDILNMTEQLILEGNIDVAKRIMGSPYYQQLGDRPEQSYMDSVPKYMLPYAMLWQVESKQDREDYFTDKIKNTIKAAARRLESYMTGPGGLMERAGSLDNGRDYLLVDNFAIMHGYAAYRYLCREWGWTEETAWATKKIEMVNSAVNKALDDAMERRNAKDWYMSCLEDKTVFYRNHKEGKILYDANWISSTLMTSTFPWDAILRGYDFGGTWSEYLDSSIDYALSLKAQMKFIPKYCWGGFWRHMYGSAYNAGMSFPLLYSEKHRTTALQSLEWLMDNQSAPLQWAESFDKGQNDFDWTIPGADFENWALGFSRQCLLESIISMKTDGTMILGRGLLDSWLASKIPVEWENIPINCGKYLDHLKISCQDNKTIVVELSGDDADGNIIVNIPGMVHNIESVSAGTVDNENGTVIVPGCTKKISVTLKNALSA